MGNRNDSALAAADANFPMQKYINSGLSPAAVLKIKEAFDAHDPVNGYISVEKVKELSKDSGDKKEIDRKLQGLDMIDFDQFFAFSADILREKLRSNPNIEIDSKEVQATCLFCPYAQDERRWMILAPIDHW